MLTERPLLIKRVVPLLLIGLSIFLFYMYFFVGMADILAILSRADLFYYSLAVISVLVSMAFYSLTWQRLLSLLSIRATLRKTLLFNWIGSFVDLLVPAESISGDVSKVYLMSKSSGENAGKVVASVISHRILSMTINLSGLIIGSVFFILRYEPFGFVLNLIIIVVTGTAISLFLVGYLCLRKKAVEKMLDWLIRLLAFITRGRWQLTRLRSKVQEILKAFHEGIAILARSPKSLAWPGVLSIAAWFFNLLVFLLVFVSLDFHFSFSAILIVYSISCAIQTVPLGIPGEVGLVEIVMTSLYTLLSIPPTISAAATVLTRIITLWFKLLLGYMAVQWVGVKVLMGSAN